MRVELYSKARCPLCEDARVVLLALKARYVFELVEYDIEADPALWDRFRFDVPVVFIAGQRAFRHRLIEEEVEKRLLQAGTPVAP